MQLHELTAQAENRMEEALALSKIFLALGKELYGPGIIGMKMKG